MFAWQTDRQTERQTKWKTDRPTGTANNRDGRTHLKNSFNLPWILSAVEKKSLKSYGWKIASKSHLEGMELPKEKIMEGTIDRGRGIDGRTTTSRTTRITTTWSTITTITTITAATTTSTTWTGGGGLRCLRRSRSCGESVGRSF